MAAPPADLWKRAKELEFSIGREAWSVYDVDDGATLRARTILIKLLKLPSEAGQPPQYIQTNAAIVDIKAPQKMRREPPKAPATPDEMARAPRTEVPLGQGDEPWNDYYFDDSGPKLIRTKLVVTGVNRIEGLYDNFGNPLYQVTHSTLVSPPVQRKVNLSR